MKDGQLLRKTKITERETLYCWNIKRYVLEEYAIEAETKQKAIDYFSIHGGTAYNITLLKETVTKHK